MPGAARRLLFASGMKKAQVVVGALLVVRCLGGGNEGTVETIETVEVAEASGPQRSAAAVAEPAGSVAAVEPVYVPDEAAGASDIQVTVGPCAEVDCLIRLHFSGPMQPMVMAQGGLSSFVAMAPEIPATLRWLDDQRLEIQPARGTLSHGTELQIHLAARSGPGGQFSATQRSVQVPLFSMAGKIATWPVVPGKPRLVGLLDVPDDRVGPGVLYALYDQPIEVSAMRPRVTVTQRRGGPSLSVRVEAPAEDRSVSGVALDRRHALALLLLDRPPPGTAVIFALPSAESPSGRVRRTLTVAPPLSVRLLSDIDSFRTPRNLRLTFSFSNYVSTDRFLEALRLTPKPKDVRIEAVLRKVHLRLELHPGTDYRLVLPAGFQDVHGNELDAPLVRTFRTRDLSPALHAPKGVHLVEAGRPRVTLKGRNLEAVRGVFVPVPSTAVAASYLLHPEKCRTAPGEGLELPQRKLKRALNQSFEFGLSLPATAGPMQGCLRLEGRGIGSDAGRASPRVDSFLQVSDLGITAKLYPGKVLVWVTSLKTARPVRGAEVALGSATGVTGEHGLAELAVGAAVDEDGPSTPLVVVAKHRGDRALLPLDRSSVSAPHSFGLPAAHGGPAPLAASIFSDRGVYRPGEKVHLAFLVRTDDGLKVPVDEALRLEVTDPRGKTLRSEVVLLDAYGMADVAVDLDADASVGRYRVGLARKGRQREHHFRVEAYRVPSFEVRVTPGAAWKIGTPGRAQVQARYLHGGALANRALRYEVTRTPAPVRSASFPGFRFAGRSELAGRVAGRSSRLGADGGGRVEFPIELPADAGPMRYELRATVTDVDRQAYAGRAFAVVHPTDIYVGAASPPSRFVPSPAAHEVRVAAVDHAGDPVAGVTVQVSLLRAAHHSVARVAGSHVDRMNHRRRDRVGACTVTTGLTGGACRVSVRKPGRYWVRVSARDAKGRTTETGYELLAGGTGSYAWPRFAHERVRLLLDKKEYRVGETARLMVESPFAKATALLSIERNGVLEKRVHYIDGDTPALEVPILAGYAPNVYASVVLLRGRVHDHRDATGFETGAPSFRLGYAEISVAPDRHEARVAVSTKQAAYAPGAEVTGVVHITDPEGRPLGGQAVVMVVDEAVLGLTAYRTPRPLSTLLFRRSLAVRTGDGRLDMLAARRIRHEAVFPSGDGGDGFGVSPFAKQIRSFFRSTAYFNAKVPVDAFGRGVFRFELPDNVTAYRVMAVAATKAGRFGSSSSRIVARKPLIVRPVLPRFVHRGDRFALGVQVFNGTKRALEVSLRIDAQGLQLAGTARDVRRIEPGASESFSFPAEVISAKALSLSFSGRAGGVEDNVSVQLPVLDFGARQHQLVEAWVEGQQALTLPLPERRIPGTTELEVLLSTSRLTELKGAVEYLMEYPHGCIE